MLMARILIVDDQKMICELLKDVLTQQGHVVDAVYNGLEAVDRVMKQSYDVVVIDRHMPEMTGIEAISLIRRNPRFKDLKIIICTSAAINGEIEEAFDAGANDYLIKPVDIHRLTAKIQKALSH